MDLNRLNTARASKRRPSGEAQEKTSNIVYVEGFLILQLAQSGLPPRVKRKLASSLQALSFACDPHPAAPAATPA